MAGKGSLPGERKGGRGKGTPNKVNADIKAMILGALASAGGQKYLEAQAKTNPTAFLSLVGKILPREVTGANGGPIDHALKVTVKFAGDA